MRNHDDGSTQYPSVPANPEPNVFTGDFLRRLNEEDEPPTASEALLRSPECLATLLQAAGKVTLERVGTLLDLRVPTR